MKIKTKYSVLVILILGLYLFFGGYRFTPRQAANAYNLLEKEAEEISEVDVGWGYVYIYRVSEDDFMTVLTTRKGFLWRAPVSTQTNVIKDKNDKIRTIGWMSYTNNNKEKATVLVIENKDEQVFSIDAGQEAIDRTKKNVSNEDMAIFAWDEALFLKDINPVAYSKDNREVYRYGYPQETTTFNGEDLRWYPIQ